MPHQVLQHMLATSSIPSRKAFKVARSARPRGMAATAVARIHEGSSLKDPLDDSKPVLYTHVLCPYAQRAWLALLEKGVDFTLVNVDLSSKPGWYTRLNPAALVPAVAFATHVQTESLDICRWVDASFEGRPLVLPGKDKETAELINSSRGFSSAGLSFLAGSTGRSWGIGQGQTDSQRNAFVRQVEALVQRIESNGGPFLTGNEVSLADIAYYPFAERFDIAMPEFCNFDLRTALSGKFGRWLEAMERQSSVQTSAADAKLLLKALKQHLSLDFFDFHTYTAAALHPQLEEALAST